MNRLARMLAPCLLAGTVVCSLAHSAIEPVPRAEQGWQERHKILNERALAAGDKARVIFIGASIVERWESVGKEVWDKYYAPRNAVNLGIGGDRTQHVLWRLDHGNLQSLKPKAAVVSIGSNNSNGDDHTPAQIADGVRAIVTKLHEKLPGTRVILVGLFPRDENPTPQRGKILMANQIMRTIADEKEVFWVDFGHEFIDPQGNIPREMMPDFLHPNEKGYRIWAEAIEPTVKKLMGG